jgi:purine-binding chemotaxis protein CheW
LEHKTQAALLGEESDQLISFGVESENYGVNIQSVKEVIKIREITKLPKAPSFVKGVINLRGDVIPIIDFRDKFGLEQNEYTDITRVIVVEVDKKSIGIVVDRVSHVIRMSQDEITPPPPMIGSIAEKYLLGIGKKGEDLIILIDIEKILSIEEKIELDEMLEKSKKTAKAV